MRVVCLGGGALGTFFCTGRRDPAELGMEFGVSEWKRSLVSPHRLSAGKARELLGPLGVRLNGRSERSISVTMPCPILCVRPSVCPPRLPWAWLNPFLASRFPGLALGTSIGGCLRERDGESERFVPMQTQHGAWAGSGSGTVWGLLLQCDLTPTLSHP